MGNTFERRQTPVPEKLPFALTDEFLEDAAKLTQWAAFGKRLGLGGIPKLPMVVRYIGAFLMPVVDAARTGRPLGRDW